MASIACLLLTLTARAVTPPDASGAGVSASDSHHYWPLDAVGRTDDRAARRIDFVSTGTSLDLAVQEMQQVAAQLAPPSRDSLLHVDLGRGVRLAMVTRAVGYTSRFGATSVSVGLFSLQW
jgi:hypothetical protein